MLFPIVMCIVILQRLIELLIAKRNEKWMRSRGAFEVGARHYPIMVLMHITFFISLIIEVTMYNPPLSRFWLLLLVLFVLAQAFRVWCLVSLGKFWNTKIIILYGAEVVRKGPYRLLRHPNYAVVSVELLLLPLLFSAYFTTIIFTLLNIGILSVRIPLEEKALIEATDYEQKFNLK